MVAYPWDFLHDLSFITTVIHPSFIISIFANSDSGYMYASYLIWAMTCALSRGPLARNFAINIISSKE